MLKNIFGVFQNFIHYPEQKLFLKGVFAQSARTHVRGWKRAALRLFWQPRLFGLKGKRARQKRGKSGKAFHGIHMRKIPDEFVRPGAEGRQKGAGMRKMKPRKGLAAAVYRMPPCARERRAEQKGFQSPERFQIAFLSKRRKRKGPAKR